MPTRWILFDKQMTTGTLARTLVRLHDWSNDEEHRRCQDIDTHICLNKVFGVIIALHSPYQRYSLEREELTRRGRVPTTRVRGCFDFLPLCTDVLLMSISESFAMLFLIRSSFLCVRSTSAPKAPAGTPSAASAAPAPAARVSARSKEDVL